MHPLAGHPVLLAICLLVLGVPYWMLVTYVIGLITGWAALARRFRFDGEFLGHKWSMQSARMRRFGGYNNCLTIGSDPSGLYLAMPRIFRVGHSPLLIPWPEITVLRGEKGLLIKRREFLLGREESVSCRLTASLAQAVQHAAGGSWPVESDA